VTSSRTLIRPGLAWVWLPPAVAILLLVLIFATSSNLALFLALNHLSNFTGDAFWADMTALGDTVTVIALLLPFWRKRPDVLWVCILAALFATLWSHGLKHLVHSPRPPGELPLDSFHVIGPVHKWDSFPSGHTTSIFTLAAIMALTTLAKFQRWLWLLIAVLVALSRCAVGVHWPLDIVGGALGGWLSALTGLWVAERWHWGVTRVGRTIIALLPLIAATTLVIGYDAGYSQTAWFLRWVGVICLLLAAYQAATYLKQRD
jgi:membrane-associated phospholipid phosphatase